MNRTRETICAVAAVLVLAGCGADGDGGDPVPDPGSTSTSSSATSPGPVSPAPTSPAPSTPAATTTLPSAVPTNPEGGPLSLAESCQAVLDDQQDAVQALRDYAGDPLDAKGAAAGLDRLRSELAAGELSAPEPLRQELGTQVRVLTSAVQGLRTGTVQRIDLDAFQGASERITTLCESARR